MEVTHAEIHPSEVRASGASAWSRRHVTVNGLHLILERFHRPEGLGTRGRAPRPPPPLAARALLPVPTDRPVGKRCTGIERTLWLRVSGVIFPRRGPFSRPKDIAWPRVLTAAGADRAVADARLRAQDGTVRTSRQTLPATHRPAREDGAERTRRWHLRRARKGARNVRTREHTRGVSRCGAEAGAKPGGASGGAEGRGAGGRGRAPGRRARAAGYTAHRRVMGLGTRWARTWP